MKPCDKCGSDKIIFYKQRRADGVWVVTARCDKGHHPITGKPFYPVANFDIDKLSPLPGTEVKQPELFQHKEKEQHAPLGLLEFVEQLQNLHTLHTPKRKHE